MKMSGQRSLAEWNVTDRAVGGVPTSTDRSRSRRCRDRARAAVAAQTSHFPSAEKLREYSCRAAGQEGAESGDWHPRSASLFARTSWRPQMQHAGFAAVTGGVQPSRFRRPPASSDLAAFAGTGPGFVLRSQIRFRAGPAQRVRRGTGRPSHFGLLQERSVEVDLGALDEQGYLGHRRGRGGTPRSSARRRSRHA